MSTHRQGIGIIFACIGLTSGTTKRRYLYQVITDDAGGAAANDDPENWNEQPENYDYVNTAYGNENPVNGKRVLIHDFAGSVEDEVFQDYIVETLGFNALPEGMIFRAKTKTNATHAVWPVPEPGTDSAGVTEYLELDGDVNPVTVPDSTVTPFWSGNGASGTYIAYCMFWDYRPLIDTFSGDPSQAGWRFRWNDTNDTLEMSFDGVNWNVIAQNVTTLQQALDALAGAYPTEDYDAAIANDGTIRVQPGSGGAGTITFSSEFQTILTESDGTWILPMKWGVDRTRWV